ncbi:unnamed protein product [Adineta steineri]|uniref:Retrotransposon gag domain-containing protein n=1 Tax=Adineta steineri TaxID=433720 RepID=A0A814C9B4_9BILA|nr:unnamed protein product [Adineta steineri]CAF3859288.1 unnamed protein product [Adineta steineri]
MAPEKTPSETLSVEKAVQRIHEMCVNNAERVKKLEEQYNQMLQNFTQKHEEIEARIVNIQSQNSEMHIKATSTLEENKQQFDEIKQQCNEMMRILHSSTKKEQLEPENIHEASKTASNYLTSIQPTLNIADHLNNTSKSVPSFLTNEIQTQRSQTIMIPSPTTIPTFSGKCLESPNQFLIRIEEYTEAVYGWNQTTLLFHISEFLRGTALNWYCQLTATHQRPKIWAEFVSLFLSQFNPHVRTVSHKQEWLQCKQWEDETINEFLIRLRTIWFEQKPKETEADFIKHLLCKMRSDLFTMMGVSPGASLDEIILKAQKVEEILFLRNEEHRVTEYFKQISFKDNTLDTHKYRNGNDINHHKSTQFSNLEYSLNEQDASPQRNKYYTKEQWNDDESSQNANSNAQFTVDHSSSKTSNPIKCGSCGIFGHYTKICPHNNANNYQSSTSNSHSKNAHGALRERNLDAHP